MKFDNKEFGKRLESYYLARGLSQAKVAALAETSQAEISRIKNGKIPKASHAMLSRICRAIGTSIDEIMGVVEKNAPAPESTAIYAPVLGEVTAGTPLAPSDSVTIYDEDDRDKVPIPASMYGPKRIRKSHRLVCCRVSGLSMAPEYKPHDLLVVEELQEVNELRNRDHVIVDLGNGNGITFKVFDKPKHCLTSLARDEYFEFFPLEQYPEHRLYGRVIGLLRTRP